MSSIYTQDRLQANRHPQRRRFEIRILGHPLTRFETRDSSVVAIEALRHVVSVGLRILAELLDGPDTFFVADTSRYFNLPSGCLTDAHSALELID